MSACTFRQVIVTGLILASTRVAVAQDDDKTRIPYYGSGGSILISLLTRPGVQKELGLDDAVSKKLVDSLREIEPKNIAFRTPEIRQQFNKIETETSQKMEAAIQKALTEKQRQRLEQLELQYLGGRALLTFKTPGKWELTDEQQERLATIRKAFNRDDSVRNGEDSSTSLERYKNDLLAVLTSDQIKQWKEMVGTPFKVPKTFVGPAWRLVLLPEVQQELGLPDEGAKDLEQSLEAIQKEASAERVRAISPEPGNRDFAESMRRSPQIIDAVKSTLTVPQWNRLQELILQQSGPTSLTHHEVAQTLGLTQEQQDRVREIIAVRRSAFTEERPSIGATEARARRLKQQADLLDVLTPDQKQQWEAMQGKKVDMVELRRPATAPAE